MFRATGAESLPRGAHVSVRVAGCDLLTLDVHGSVVARLDGAVAADTDTDADDAADAAGPLLLAIDMQPDGADTEPAAAEPTA